MECFIRGLNWRVFALPYVDGYRSKPTAHSHLSKFRYVYPAPWPPTHDPNLLAEVLINIATLNRKKEKPEITRSVRNE